MKTEEHEHSDMVTTKKMGRRVDAFVQTAVTDAEKRAIREDITCR